MPAYEHVACGVLAVALGSLGTAPRAFAQGPASAVLSGAWRAGATQFDVVLGSWGEDCGPKPQPSRSNGGGTVTLEQSRGQIVIHSRDRETSSNQCWSKNPAIKRQSATFSGNAWVTKCRTPANHPQEEQGTYTLRIVGADTLQYQDVSRYNWALKDSVCVATYTTTQTLTRRNSTAATQAEVSEKTQKPLAQAKPEPVPLEPPPEPEDKDDDKACSPGAPHKLVLRPRRAEIEVGQRACFRPRITDQAGCAIKDQAVQWSLSHSKALRGSLREGCFTAGDNAAEAEGDFKIVATLGPLRSEASVAVHPVDLSALIAKRIGGGALTGFDEELPLPAAAKSVTRVATRREPEPSQASPRRLIGIALGLAATALALAALWLSRRKLPARARPSSPSSAPLPSLPPPLPSRAPVAHSRPAAAGVPHIRSGVPASQGPLSSGPPPPSGEREPWICPKCRVGYPAEQQTCPKDGTTLMPYAEFARSRKRTEDERKKRCPRCGAVFPAHASFCAEDGTPLV